MIQLEDHLADRKENRATLHGSPLYCAVRDEISLYTGEEADGKLVENIVRRIFRDRFAIEEEQ